MGEEVVKVSGIFKKFKNKIVLKNVNLSINKKEIIGLTGPSGCGKTVLIKMLMGYLKPDKGRIIINSRIGFSVQDNSYYENLTLKQNLNYFAKINNIKNRKEKIKELLNILSLEGYEKNILYNLSGGTKKRVDLACALLNDPQILILDEPFVGLDYSLIQQLSSLLARLRDNGMTIIMSSHVLEPIENLCDRVLFIKDGELNVISKSQIRDLY